MPPFEYAIVVDKLVKKFGKLTAVKEVSFKVKRGEIFGFLGPNGSGKSTTIRMICGLLLPSSGTIQVLGFRAAEEPEKVKSRIGYLSQKFGLYPDLTLRENLEFYGGIYGILEKEQKIQAAIAGLGLEQWEKTLAGELPSGVKQFLGLSCATLHSPRLVFLDEPTAGMDPLLKRRFWEIVQQMAKKEVTLMVTTHFLEEAEYCNRIGLISKGELIALGSPSELKRQDFPGVLLRLETPQPVKAKLRLELMPEIAGITSSGAAFLNLRVKEADKAIPVIKQSLKEEGIEILSLEPVTPKLEDLFVALMQERGEGEHSVV